jgi:hypothetical protein
MENNAIPTFYMEFSEYCIAVCVICSHLVYFVFFGIFLVFCIFCGFLVCFVVTRYILW